MKKIFFVLGVLTSISVQAQLLETIGGVAIGGSVVSQGARSTQNMMSMVKQNQIIQGVGATVMNAKINPTGDYSRISSVPVDASLRQYNATLTPEGFSAFSLNLFGVDKNMCDRLISARFGTYKIMVNNQPYSMDVCAEDNNIQLFFN